VAKSEFMAFLSGFDDASPVGVGIEKKSIRAPEVLNEPIEYEKSFSRGIRLELDKYAFLFISGTASIDERGNTYCPHDFLAQVDRTYKNLTALLKSGGASWQNVVKTVCYLKNVRRDYGKFNAYRNKFYSKIKLSPFPASVAVGAELCRPELLVEIEATAVVKKRAGR